MPNLPATTYIAADGDITNTGVLELADASGVLLVDASSNNLVDNGQVLNPLPATTYSIDETQ